MKFSVFHCYEKGKQRIFKYFSYYYEEAATTTENTSVAMVTNGRKQKLCLLSKY